MSGEPYAYQQIYVGEDKMRHELKGADRANAST
jgi:hypothetical protein